MKKQAKRIIARIMTVLMILSVLPLDALGMGGAVVKADAGDFHEHDFTEDGLGSDEFFTIEGAVKASSTSDVFSVEYGEKKLTVGIKGLDTTFIKFAGTTSGTLTVVSGTAGNILVDDVRTDITAVSGTNYYSANVTISARATDHKIVTKGGNNKSRILYISFLEDENSGGGDNPGTVNPPTANPGSTAESMAVPDGQLIKLTAEGADSIKYTLNGDDPNTDGLDYTIGGDGIAINPPVTLKAIAIKGTDTSDVVTYEYTLDTTSNVPKPTADPSSGAELEAGSTVELKMADGVDSIRYTLDNSEQLTDATSGMEYSGPITITTLPATLRAIAVQDGEISEIATFNYTLKLADAPVVDVTSGTAVEKGKEVTITATGADAIHYTVNGSDPTVESENVTKETGDTATVTINEALTIKAVAMKNGVASKQLEASYTILKAATPRADKTGGVEEGTEITLTSATAGAEIYYTMGKNVTDPDPEAATTPHGPSPVKLTITEDITIKAIAVKDKYDNSDVATFNYKIMDTTGLVKHVLDPDAIVNDLGKTKYSYSEPTEIAGTDGYFTAMANSAKGASLSKIEDITTKVNDVPTSCYDNLSWADVNLTEREYAIAITGGAMEKNTKGTPQVIVSAIKFTTQAYATGVVYFSIKETPKNAQDFVIKSGNDTTLSSTVASTPAGNNTKVGKLEFELPVTGTYYVGFSGSGGIIPYMEVIEDYTKESEKGPEEVKTKTITVSDSTNTIIDADLLGDVDFYSPTDADKESVDAVNILLKAASITENDVSTGIKNKVADQMKFMELESDNRSKAYYYNLSLEDKTSNNALALKQGGVKFQVSYDKLGIDHKDALVVFNGTTIISEDKITRDKKSKSFWVEADADELSRPYIFVVNSAKAEPGKLAIVNSYGYEEGACAEWNDYTATAHDGYVAYVSTTPVFPDNGKTQRIDNELIRKYDGYWRVDTVGLKPGTYYIKVDAVKVNATTKEPTEVVASSSTGPLKVTNYDRSGFAFSKNSDFKTGSGAYNDDGTLRAGAQVLYVTAATAKTVTLDVITSNKGAVTKCVGLQSILDAREKGYDTTPLDIRLIGCVTLGDLDHISSTEEGLQVKGSGNYAEMNITIEGIGEDAAVYGFGIFLRNCGNVELRNFAVMYFLDDGISLDTANCNIWVHDLDIFYGKKGSAADQVKGDGTIDLKGHSKNLTIAYNHFWDSGKSSLCGMKSESTDDVITYHHNWFDHSDSRHPRIRTATVHIYNNYFDGNSKYGVGMTMGGSAFVEANYFRHCKYPMMISKQGTDALGTGTFSGENGGVIKAYNNKIEQAKHLVYANSTAGGATEPANATQFDAYLASSRGEAVPGTYTAVAGGTTYNNFDTSGNLDLGVDPSNIDDPSNVKAIVTVKAGRLNGGDFARVGYAAFFGDDADERDAIDDVLRDDVVAYTTSVKAIGGIDGVATPVSGSSSVGAVTPSSGVVAPVASVTSGVYSETKEVTLSSDTSGAVIYYTIDGSNPADSGNTGREKFNGTPISVGSSMVIKAVAVVEENGKAVDSSYVAKYSYIISSDGGTRYTVTIYKIEGEVLDTLTFNAGDRIMAGDLPNPTRDGYTFTGWKDGTGNDVTLPQTVNGNMTLIAQWEKNKATYTITIDLNYEGAPAPTIQTVQEGEPLNSLETPKRTGFIFDGWEDENGNAITIPFTPEKSMTIKATWEPKDLGDDEHWVVYIDKNDGSKPERVEVEKEMPIPNDKLADPVRKDYTFNGWVDEDNNKITLPYTPDKNMTIKATWTKNDTSTTSEFWSVKLEKTEYTYTGTAIKPGVSVYDNNGKALVEGVDYTVKYSNNLKASVVKEGTGYKNINENTKKQPTVTVSGKGILSGKYTENFVIKPKNISNANDNEVQSAEIRIVKGSKASAPVICYNGMKLGAKDYKYTTPGDKTKKFSADGTIEIEGQGNYEGTRSITVNVFDNKTALKAAVKKFKVTVKNASALAYTGDNLREKIIKDYITLTPALPEGSYAVTLPDEVKDAGTVKFMVVGLGDYSGCSVSKSIKIQPMALDEAKVDITGVPSAGVNYSNTGAVLSELSIKLKDKTEALVNGRDYKLSYSSNKKTGNASYTITFKGNYKGKIAKKTFKINKAPLDETNGGKVELPDKVCKENTNCKSTPYVTVNGVMVKASEYEVQYCVGSKSATPTNKPKVTFGSNNSVIVYVNIKAKTNSKNYETGAGNEITGHYTVWKKGSSDKDLSKAKVTFHNQADCKDKKVTKFEYNGGEVKPGGINVNIGKSGANLYSQDDTNSQVTVTYVNNVNKGKATVIIKPAADSGLIGSKVVTFSIVSKNASGLSKSVLEDIKTKLNISDTIKELFK